MWKKLWEWIKRPHGWSLIAFYLFTAVCVAGAIVFSVTDVEGSRRIEAYIFYAFAAITFSYSVYSAVILIPKLKAKIVGFLKKFKFSSKLIEEYDFRTITFAIASCIISLGNAVINGVIGIANISSWYIALGVYYIFLASMRGGVLLFHRKKNKKYLLNEDERQIKIREIKSYRTCGVLLFLLPLALSSVVAEMVYNDRAFVHSGLMIYASAAYTCYKIIMSIVNFIKARKGDVMTVRAIRNVNLADALVSVLALQTAMFHEFSPEKSFGFANAITGTVICIITVVLGLVMIINGSIKISELKKLSAEIQTE